MKRLLSQRELEARDALLQSKLSRVGGGKYNVPRKVRLCIYKVSTQNLLLIISTAKSPTLAFTLSSATLPLRESCDMSQTAGKDTSCLLKF